MAGDKVADAFFFTTGGGYTENNEIRLGFEQGQGHLDARSATCAACPDYDENGVAYDAGGRDFSWSSSSFTWTQLQTMLGRDSRTNVGSLLDLKFSAASPGASIASP